MDLINNKIKEFLSQNKYLCERDLEVVLNNNKKYFKRKTRIF